MQIQVLPQIDATVCKPAKRPDFQSGHRKMCAGSNPVRSTNKEERQRWRVGLVCKTSVLRLSGFESHLSHKWSYRLMVRITDFQSVDTGSPR